MEDAMTNYLPAIDIMMCHLGISFEQACEQLGLSQQEQQSLILLQKQTQSNYSARHGHHVVPSGSASNKPVSSLV